MKKKRNSRIFIISGPGGAGKTTILNQLFGKKHISQSFMKGVTITTRPRRPQEEEAEDYFFVSKEEFLTLKRKDFFLESQKILDNYYGTPKIFYRLAKSKRKDLILCLDVKGAMYLKKNYKAAKIITIFIAVPSEKDLYQRMKKRIEANALMKERVKLAKKELQFSQYYDYLIVNQNLKRTLRELEKIILVHHQ